MANNDRVVETHSSSDNGTVVCVTSEEKEETQKQLHLDQSFTLGGFSPNK